VRRSLLSILAVALLLGGWNACAAQEAPAAGLKPLVTVSFSGYDELKADIEFIGKLGDNAELAQGLEGMLKLFTQGQGLAGLDTTKPWGAVMLTDGQQAFPVYGFVPVTDLKQLLSVVGPLLPGGPPEEAADGVYELDLDGPTVFIQEKGGWALITSSREDLANVPADPLKVLGGLHQKYDLAVRASIQNVPLIFRQMFFEQIQAGAEVGMERLPGESDEDYAIRQGVTKKMMQQLNTTVNQLDEVLIGWAIDRQTGNSYIDFQVTAVAGTKTAAQFAQVTAAKTNFAGFDLPGAALTGNWAGTVTDADVAEAKNGLANLRATALKELENQDLSADELQLAKQLLSDLLEVLEKTIESKTMDGGLALMLKSGGLTFVAGGAIADGAKLEKALKQLAVEIQKEEPNLLKGDPYLLKLDAETHQGVRFHTLAIPTDEMDDENVTKLFGDTLDVVLGISETSVYLSAGRDAASTLKQVIDGSKANPGKDIPPMRISLAATPIAQFVAAVAEEEEVQQMAAMVAAMLAQTDGKDHLTLTSQQIPNGAVVRLEIEEGLLKLLGSLGQMFGGMAAPGGPGAPGEVPPPDDTTF
jgi:hypothetical protein